MSHLTSQSKLLLCTSEFHPWPTCSTGPDRHLLGSRLARLNRGTSVGEGYGPLASGYSHFSEEASFVEVEPVCRPLPPLPCAAVLSRIRAVPSFV